MEERMRKMTRISRVLIGCLIFFTAISFPMSVSRAASEWKNPTYNFQSIKKILVKNLTVHYESREFNLSSKDQFDKYSDAETKSLHILQDRFIKPLSNQYRFIFEAPPQDMQTINPPQANQSAVPKDNPIIFPISNAILTIKIIDMGCFWIYHPSYNTWETVTDEEVITYTDSSGKERKAKRTIKRQVLVTRPAGYNGNESAGAEFTLHDSKTGEAIWRYTDIRHRSGTDKTGPESIMKRIFTDASKKLTALSKTK